MRKLLTALLFALTLVAACGGDVRQTRFTADNREAVIDRVFKSGDLTEEERSLAALAIGRYQGTGKELAGKSVGEFIEEQRGMGE